MQKQEILKGITIEYVSFDRFFRENGDGIHMDYHVPLKEPMEWVHHHDALELGYCMEGSGVFWIDGIQYPYRAPCASLIYPGQLHRACSTEDSLSRWIFFTLPALGRKPGGVFPGGVFSESRLLVLLEEAFWECREQRAGYERCACNLLETAVIRYERGCARGRERAGTRCSLPERLQEVLRYIAGHYKEEITLSSLSRLVFVHESTLRIWFQKAFGTSPMQYVHQTRIAVACTLLATTKEPVSRVAEEVGYLSLSSFNRHFASRCGCSPGSYRHKMGGRDTAI